jgi:hypothetical protein
VGQICEILGKEYAKVLSVNELQRKGTGKQQFLLTTDSERTGGLTGLGKRAKVYHPLIRAL